MRCFLAVLFIVGAFARREDSNEPLTEEAELIDEQEPRPVSNGHTAEAPDLIDEQVPLPAFNEEAAEDFQWRLAATPGPGFCGWLEVECYDKTTGETVFKFNCASGNDLQSEASFRGENAFVTDGCDAKLVEMPFEKACFATVNDPGLKVKRGEGAELVERCTGPDLLIVAGQEMGNDFKSYVNDLKGYKIVASCHLARGPSVVVAAVESSANLFLAGDCQAYEQKFDISNSKGSAVLPVYTPAGKLVVASTHGIHAGVESESRVTGFKRAARMILGLEPMFVAWGGDFNVRTPVSGHGTTIGELVASAKRSPNEAFHALAKLPDYLGDLSKTFSEELAEVGAGNLVEIDVHGLCPSYRKASKHFTKKTAMQKMFGGGKLVKRNGRFECQADGSDLVEKYILHNDNEGNKWPDRAPSWTERLIINNRLNCAPADKIPVDNDHDTVYTTCTITR